ncbi:hypothetical protein MML48_1g02520 [Holotrichia oblita]|uniref:Uncharacterized protein n=1 Tax=Holotrichia oblita TaxID=644536 RepID=A0ACB9TUU2_HOLOL|nr:hypothetical protein MML48_1g02520 [Holotrichia oblita]
MLEGWYCRSIANEAAAAEEEERLQEESKLRTQYKFLKGKLKHLLYENECFQQALRSAQKRLLSITRDRSFLLDRLLLYEKTDNSSTESDETDSSDEESIKMETAKKRRIDVSSTSQTNGSYLSGGKSIAPTKKKKPNPVRQSKASHNPQSMLQLPINASNSSTGTLLDGHMTPEEVERHLQSRQSFMELERAPPTVPTEMFSNEPSLDSESNDLVELETSPSNMGEELSIDMIQE